MKMVIANPKEIRGICRILNIPIEAIAKRAGVTRQTIYNLEDDRINSTKANIVLIGTIVMDEILMADIPLELKEGLITTYREVIDV